MTAAAPRRPDFLESEPFVVELERFRGPLDLLLHLIRSQDIDVFDIPIAHITRQFRSALDAGLHRVELDRAGEFLEMASTLVRIKAQLLLPRSGDPDWEEDPRSNLVRRLLEYEHFHEVARTLAARESERSRHLGKGYVEPRAAPDRYLPELESTRKELIDAARGVPEPRPEPETRPPVREVTVEEKISLLGRLLRKAKRLAFERLFQPWNKRSHAVAALLACLELARQQRVKIEQVELFGSIWLFPGPSMEEDGAGGTARDDAAGPGEGGGGIEGEDRLAGPGGNGEAVAGAAAGDGEGSA
jgi:segregation and condensation protein A